jgi:hypothetical protein
MENRLSISTSEWKGYISTTYAELFGAVAETGLRYFESTQALTADGSTSYDEPTGLLSLVGIDFIDGSGRRRELDELMAQERNFYAGRTGEARAYMLVDDQLYLYPKPASGSYEWLYIPQPPDLTNGDDADNIDVVTPDGEALVLWGVAVQALAKEGSDVNVARAEREEARARVSNWATMRMLHNPRRQVLADNPYVDRDGDFPRYGGA